MKTVAFFDAKSYDRESFKRFEDEDISIRFFENKLNADTVSMAACCDGVCVFVNDTLDRTVIEKLAEYGLSIREYTRLEVDTATYGAYYANNPDLAPRVREYKNHLDRLGLAYTSTTDDISAAIQADETLSETEKLQLAQEIKAAFDNIALNLQALGIEAASFEAWRPMAKLIRFLPEEE